jgi:hypothetical protein
MTYTNQIKCLFNGMEKMNIQQIKDARDIHRTRDSVLVLGYFDGLHRGHKALFDQARAIAKRDKLDLTVLTFNDSPRLALARFTPELLLNLTAPEKRYEKFAEYGVDDLYLVDFTSAFSKVSSEEFLNTYIKALRARTIVVGFDYKFGHDRRDAAHLSEIFDGDVIVVPEVQDNGEKISSSRIRQEILSGNVSEVNRLLGYERDYGKMYPEAEVERLAQGAAGVKRTTGQHPGGIVVIPNYMDVYDFTPVQYPADDLSAEWQTTHFNFHDIDENVLKLDILGHDDPTMIRKLQDLSGIDPKDIPADDPDVMALFSGTEVLGVTPEQIGTPTGMLGIPEFGTNFVRGMVEETHPTTFAELLQLSGLSHGTDVWLGNAQDLIKEGIATLKTVIGCRDDIMVYLMHAGLDPKMAFTIMERVRKGRWLKISDEERNGYIQAMRDNNVPDWYIESCGKIKYMFPKAHAAAYVLMALRVAYFKVHYPLYYYCAYFSIRAKAFDIKTMSAGLDAVKERMAEISTRRKNNEASNVEIDLYTTLELVNEMLERGFKFGQLDLYRSDATEFIIDGDTLIPPFVAMDGLGENVAKQIVKAREEGEFLSKMELRKRGGVSATLVEKMDEMGILGNMPEDNQLSLFDDFF